MGKQDGWTFVHSERRDAVWENGLRETLSYRYLGTDAGTNGAYVAQVIKNNGKEQKDAVREWHVHDCTFQMTYVLTGWATFEWEGSKLEEEFKKSGEAQFIPITFKEHWTDIRTIQKTNGTKYTDESLKGLKVKKKKKKKKTSG